VKDRAFSLPNLRVIVSFIGKNEESTLILYSPDRVSVEQRLKRRHGEAVVIKAIETYDFREEWGRKARARQMAVEEARAEQRPYDFSRNAIWGELKDFLFDLFDDTCAYCECSLKATSYGAVEHYRPKHPYDWLAYEVTNYLPTCTRCNTNKSDRFPLSPGSDAAKTHDDLAKEIPLLLNPYCDGPVASHLTFVNRTGRGCGPLAKGLTPRGEASIAILDLNRGDLLAERLHAQRLACADFINQWQADIRPIPVLAQLAQGVRPFSAAALKAVQAIEPKLPSLG
jgi:uncharacterized protein (TIGR02646 family)